MSALVTALDRREFLKLTGLSAGCLVLGWRPGDARAAGPLRFDLFLSLDASGRVEIVAHRSEMGQGIRTALPLVLADEMDADFDRVGVVQALGDERYGSQNTDGSHSIRDFFEPMRKVGATARHMLVTAAAQAWGVPAGECETAPHVVLHRPSGRRLGYGELAERAAAVPVPDAGTLKLKTRAEWRYIGKGRKLVDVPDIVTGRAVFGIDARMEGMLHASIERSPVVGRKPTSFDREAALKVPGVRHVEELETVGLSQGMKPLGGVAVVADHTWAALQGRKALKVAWSPAGEGSYDSAAYRKQLEGKATQPAKVVKNRGDVDAALAAAAKRVSALYYAPHLIHAAIEPPAALASVRQGRCEIWACTQDPMGARKEVAQALGLPIEVVTLHVTLLGGGFGRKSKPDFIIEAALLSQKVGRPVKVTWTREDEIRHGFYHSVSAQHLEARTGRRGTHGRVAAPHGLPVDRLHLRREDGVPAELGAGHGLHRPALRRAPPAPRECADRAWRPHRVDAVGVERLPRLRHRLLRGRAGPRRGRRSQGLPVEADRRAATRGPQGRRRRRPELRRLAPGLPAGHRAPAPRDRARRRSRRAGASSCRRAVVSASPPNAAS